VWGVFFTNILIEVFNTISVWDKLAAGWGDLSRFFGHGDNWTMGGVPFLCGLGVSPFLLKHG